MRAYGAVKGKKKFPWRYRWPDDVRDDVLACLLALNAERYGEEVALGLHGKGGKQGGLKRAQLAVPPAGSDGVGRPRPVRWARLATTTASRWGWDYEPHTRHLDPPAPAEPQA